MKSVGLARRAGSIAFRIEGGGNKSRFRLKLVVLREVGR